MYIYIYIYSIYSIYSSDMKVYIYITKKNKIILAKELHKLFLSWNLTLVILICGIRLSNFLPREEPSSLKPLP